MGPSLLFQNNKQGDVGRQKQWEGEKFTVTLYTFVDVILPAGQAEGYLNISFADVTDGPRQKTSYILIFGSTASGSYV